MLRQWSTSFLLGLFLVAGGASSLALAQEPGVRDEQPPIPIEEIIEKFSSKESEFRRARENYVYRQDVTVQELDANNRVLGEYHVISDILFEPNGRRTEKIVYAPMSTLRGIQITPQDLQDIREIQPFVLTAEDLHLYNIRYVGKEQIDEIDNYVFDVGPKKIEEGERYFEGRIWVDDLDFQIVKTFGKAVPDIIKDGQENLFPRFETYREQIDAFWFPTYTRAVDTLNFSSGSRRIRQVIKYENYKQFATDVKLTFGDAVEEEGEEKPTEAGEEAPEGGEKGGEATKKKGPGE